MAVKFFAILTNRGAEKLANAAALGTTLNISHMAVGDGGGVLPIPDAAQSALVAEKRRAAINLLTVDPLNASQIIAEQVIPENEGGWWIREIGLFDDDGELIAVANCAETYKPMLQEGSGRTQVIRITLIVSSTAAVTLKIDPSVVLATRKYVDDAAIVVRAYADELMEAHIGADNPHTQYPLIANALKEMADAGLVADVLKNLGLGEAAKREIGTGTNQIPDMNSFMSGGNSNAKYSRLPDGLIIQRGTATVGLGGATISLPTAMPSSNYVILCLDIDGTVGSGQTLAGAPLSATTMHLHGINWNNGAANDGSPGTICWVAISL